MEPVAWLGAGVLALLVLLWLGSAGLFKAARALLMIGALCLTGVMLVANDYLGAAAALFVALGFGLETLAPNV